MKCHGLREGEQRAHQVRKDGRGGRIVCRSRFSSITHVPWAPAWENLSLIWRMNNCRTYYFPLECHTELLPGTTGDSSGLKMSRISDGPGTTKQDLGICCEIYLTKDVTKFHSKGSPRKKTSRSKRVRDRTSVTSNCLAAVQVVITEADKCEYDHQKSYVKEASI